MESVTVSWMAINRGFPDARCELRKGDQPVLRGRTFPRQLINAARRALDVGYTPRVWRGSYAGSAEPPPLPNRRTVYIWLGEELRSFMESA